MKNKTMWIIFAGPQQHGGPGTRYIARNGQATDLKSQAAKFSSRSFAEDFAKENGILLTEITYLGEVEFTDFEIQMGDS